MRLPIIEKRAGMAGDRHGAETQEEPHPRTLLYSDIIGNTSQRGFERRQMGDPDFLGKLSSTPITELNFGDAALRRRIKHAGYTSMTDLLSLDEKAIDEPFDFDTADAIILMRKQFYRDPAAFAESVLTKRTIEKKPAEEIINRASKEVRERRAAPIHRRQRNAFRRHPPGRKHFRMVWRLRARRG